MNNGGGDSTSIDSTAAEHDAGGDSNNNNNGNSNNNSDRRQLLGPTRDTSSMSNLDASNGGDGSARRRATCGVARSANATLRTGSASSSPAALDFARIQESWTTKSDDTSDFFFGFASSASPSSLQQQPALLSGTDRMSSTASSSTAATAPRSSGSLLDARPDPLSFRKTTGSLAATASRDSSRSLGMPAPDSGGGSGGNIFLDNSFFISSAIHDAARITNWDRVLELCESYPEAATYRGRDGWTALHHACNRRCPRPRVVEALLAAHPDALIQKCEKGWLPLHYACRFKAPKEVVRLLLHMHPKKGLGTVSKVDRLGRTPLYYAIRYDAPPGVVGLLLQADPSAVLEEDQNEDSPLALVWDSWAEKTEGKRIIASFLPGGFPEPETTTVQERAKVLRQRLEKNSTLNKRWLKVNLLLKAAFGFPVEEDDGEDDYEFVDTRKDELNTSIESDASRSSMNNNNLRRNWRIVHATAAVKCHLSLFLLACALHPEQVKELDEGDLQRPGDPTGPSALTTTTSAHQTALHLAASSNSGGEPGKTVLLTLLREWREAAEIPDGIDGSLPLHRMVENLRKQDWSNHAAILYRFYPRAVQIPDSNGKLPLHRAAAAVQHVAEQEDDESVIFQLVNQHPEAVRHADNSGCLPMHYLALTAEVWDSAVEAVYNIHRNALQVRTGPSHFNRLPIHMAAGSAKSGNGLLSHLIQHHPRGASVPDAQGKLPLHLACEIGKKWTDGVETIFNAFHNAIRTAEANPRGWLPLHMAVAAPDADAELIGKLIEHYPAATNTPDTQGRYPLHIACSSGKSWNGGIKILFETDPDSMSMFDNNGYLPFQLAALRYCAPDDDDEDGEVVLEEIEEAFLKAREAKLAAEAAEIDILFNLLRAEPTVLSSNGNNDEGGR